MKRILILFQFFLLVQASAQSEFAATAFYNEFKKIYTDAQEGFNDCRGVPMKTGYESIQSEYRLKCHLPLSDSGKLVIPLNGRPYAIYYFEPDKLRLKVDQRSVNLREAIVIAFGEPLFARTETNLVNNHPFSSTLYFTNPDDDSAANALFRQTVYYDNGKYYLTLEFRGKRRQ